jgi:formylglycine-generating enzyme required for sulfatase activity
MKLRLLPILFFLAAPAFADTFGSGANQFDIDFRTIGNAGNAADTSPAGYGAVGYTYRIGTYEVSRDMITKYNALGGGPTLTMSDMTPYGGNGADKPATGVSWNEAARFVNWLNTSKGYSAAYKFTTSGFNDNIALWTISDAGYNAANPFRNSNAYYFLPSEDEWYKAAYYDPNANGGLGSYWNYATGSDSAPTAVAGGTTSGTAVYAQATATGPANITNAGGLSPYGTMAQNGNVWEWGESGFTPPNDSACESRLFRGGYWRYFRHPRVVVPLLQQPHLRAHQRGVPRRSCS